MKNTILVTGGAGYIGSQFCYNAIDSGYNIVIVDNLSTGNKKLLHPSAIFYNTSVSNVNLVNKILKKYKIKKVVHFAASTSVEESMLKPLKYYENNTINTEKLIKVCIQNNINKFIFSSTCAVYGNSPKGLVTEDAPNYPESHYGKSKYLAEILLRNYFYKYKFNLGILRYFNVVGADKKLRTGCINNTGQLFKNLSLSIKKKKYLINVFGKSYNTADGTCIRDYIDVNDLCQIHLDVLKKINNYKLEIINCGYKKATTVLQVIKEFEKFINNKIKINFCKKRPGDVEKIICDNSKLKKYVQHNYQTKLSSSVKNSILWEEKI